MSNFRKFFAVCLFFVLNTVYACPIADPHIPFRAHNTNKNNSNQGLTKAQWDKVLDKIESIYAPYLKPSGITFSADRRWDDGTVNATVGRTDNDWTIIMYGGYARSEFASEDALAILACHETGHHLGETHYYSGSYWWAAGEGQADYFTTTKCLREYFADMDNETYLQDKVIPDVVKEQCSSAWSNHTEYLICIRGALAGHQMNLVWNDGVARAFSFETPSQNVTSSTYYYHPDYQCRLDTYMSGAVCTVSKDIAFQKGDPNIGSCNPADGFSVGLRPKCWYAD